MGDARFDSVLSGNVKITKVSKCNYNIKFLQSGDITLYQVWNENDPNVNSERLILTLRPANWLDAVDVNEKTTLMENGNCKYAFVIKKGEIKGREMVWEVSTREIDNRSKNVKTELPLGIFNAVRFDVDAMPVGSQLGQTFRISIPP